MTYLSRAVRKLAFCICENKEADQLRGNREADQRLCFRYIDSTIPLLFNTKFQASSHLVPLYSLVREGPGRKPRKPVFSQRGSFFTKAPSEGSGRLGILAVTSAFSVRKNEVELYIINGKIMLLNLEISLNYCFQTLEIKYK